MSIDLLKEIKIIIRQAKKDGITKAIIVLDFGNFKVKGFRIQEKNDKLWVNPPSVLSGGKYRPTFYIEDIDLWHELQDRIIKEYKYGDIPIVENENNS
tara:strand:- start:287 stop:580 length:294 start_codon:yes stop_codon:yes gene_type:complete